MKKTTSNKKSRGTDDMRREYLFDYAKARPNRFAKLKGTPRTVVVLDPDVAKVFPTPEDANRALRALLVALRTSRPTAPTRRRAARNRAA